MSISATMPYSPRDTTGRPHESDANLLKKLVGGDDSAAAELVDRSYKMVFAQLYRLSGGDRELAADLSQETYRKAYASLALMTSKRSPALMRVLVDGSLPGRPSSPSSSVSSDV